jgi:hypothetical protein
MDGLTTPKSRLMRDVCRGLAGFCSVDVRVMAKSAMPDLEIGRHVRLSCSKPEALEANITGHAEDSAQWHRVALESRANRGHQPAHGLEKSIALASADRKAGLVISMGLTSARFSAFYV